MNQFQDSILGALPYNNIGGYNGAPTPFVDNISGGFTGAPSPNQFFMDNNGGYNGAPAPNQQSVDNYTPTPNQSLVDNNGGYNAVPISSFGASYGGFQQQYQYHNPTMQRQRQVYGSVVPAPVRYTMPPPPPLICHPDPSEVTVKEEPHGSSINLPPSIFQGNYSDGGGAGVNVEEDRKDTRRWTPEEHKLFVIGMRKFNEGDKQDWRSISRYMVTTRSPIQVASHAQKYILYNKRKLDDDPSSNARRKKKQSIHSVIVSEEEQTPEKIQELQEIIVEQQRSFFENLKKK